MAPPWCDLTGNLHIYDVRGLHVVNTKSGWRCEVGYHGIDESLWLRSQDQEESAGLYSAEAFKFSPSLSWVKPEWATSTPMITDDLIRELLALGFHQIDIGDAFYAADPDWLTRNA